MSATSTKKYPFLVRILLIIKQEWPQSASVSSLAHVVPWSEYCCLAWFGADIEDALRTIFSRFGTILDIVVRSTHKLRGQAWIVFEHSADASKAMQDLEGFPFMKKPLRIASAKSKSDAVARIDGTYSEEAVEARRQERRDAWAARQQEQKERLQGGSSRQKQKRSSAATSNCTILVENIPREANEGMLVLVFQRFPGLKEVRMMSEGQAHVEYDYEEGATAAIAGLQGFKLATDKPMKLTLL